MPYKKIVAIVGRPNIGKSTLYNRLTHTKKAIVSDESGVTRDRIYGKVDWDKRTFTLVDTGGFVPDSSEFFKAKINLQCEIAISEADRVILLVDSRTGITQVDEEIAKKLQKSNKEVIVVANKVDNREQEMDVLEFYNLGLGQPIGISALNGRNINEMLDVVCMDFPEDFNQIEQVDNNIKVAVIGKPNVGKSSLVNQLLDQEKMIVSEVSGTTRDSIDSSLKYQKKDIMLIDTAGLRRKKKVKADLEYYSYVRTLRAIDRCDIAVLMLDAREGLSKHDIDVLNEARELQKGIIIAVNKWDLIEDKTNKTVKDYAEKVYRDLSWAKYIPLKFISVTNKQRLYKLLDLVLEVNINRQKKIKTKDLNDFLMPLIKQTTPPSVNSTFIKFKYVMQGSINPPVIIFFLNEPDLLKNNYKKFLENNIRKQYDFTGVPILLKFRKS